MTSDTKVAKRRPPRGARQAGYAVAIAVNIAILVVVNRLPTWQWPPFITEDFDDLLPIINVSLAANMAINGIWMVADPDWLRAFGRVVTSAFSLAVIVQTLRVFPFDFSPYAFDWAIATRTLLILAIVGVSIGIVVDIGKLGGAVAHIGTPHPDG